jgi:hypothetical protein
MRRIALCATTALFSLGLFTSSALAEGQSHVTIDSHITPVVRAFTPNTTSAVLAINLKFGGENGTAAGTLAQAVLKFSYGAHLNGNLFPSCSEDRIRNHQACPKGSKIGGGTALGLVGADSGNPAEEPIVVTLYNGPKGKSIVFRVQGDQPAPIDVPFDAPLKTFNGGTYNYQVTVTVPEILQRVAGLPISLDFFNVKVGASRKVKGRKRGYIETLICPPSALVPLQADFSFLEQSNPFHADTYIHCGA